MNKKTQSIFSLVVGCLSALVALFYLIIGIVDLTNIGNAIDVVTYYGEARVLIRLIVVVLFDLAAAAGLCFCGIKLILAFTKKADEPRFIKLAALVFFAFHAVVDLFVLFLYIDAIDTFGAGFFIGLVFEVIGLVIAFIAVLNKTFDAKTSAIFNIIVQGFAFVDTIVLIALGTGGLGLASLIFSMLAFAVATTYFIFELILSSNGGTSEKKAVEAEDTKEVEEPKEEEPAKEDSAE